jgi:hypothetical protein
VYPIGSMTTPSSEAFHADRQMIWAIIPLVEQEAAPRTPSGLPHRLLARALLILIPGLRRSRHLAPGVPAFIPLPHQFTAGQWYLGGTIIISTVTVLVPFGYVHWIGVGMAHSACGLKAWVEFVGRY